MPPRRNVDVVAVGARRLSFGAFITAILIGAGGTTLTSIISPWVGLGAAIFIAMAGGISGVIALIASAAESVQARHYAVPDSFDFAPRAPVLRDGRPYCRPTLKSRER